MKNNYFYCEICGDTVPHIDATEIIGHADCIEAIRNDIRILNEASTSLQKMWSLSDSKEINTLRILVENKIKNLSKLGQMQ